MIRKITHTFMVLAGIYIALNYSWVHAASIAAMTSPCPEHPANESYERVRGFYGELTSSPIVRCLNEPKLGKHIEYGQTNFALGLPSIILIGPSGTNTDVIAHELSHAEFVARIGVIERELNIPVWLDEGIAMQVDQRSAYSRQALANLTQRADLLKPDLKDLSNTNFFQPGDQGVYHYAYAKEAVRRWIVQDPAWLKQLQQGHVPTYLPLERN